MRILIIGVGDAFTRKHFGSSAVIETAAGAGGDSQRYVLIDCPDLIHRALHEASGKAGWNLDASRIDDVILTHLHGDHCNGLESFGFFRRLLRMRDVSPPPPRPRLHVSQAVADRLWQRLAPAMESPMGEARPSTLEDFFDVRILAPGQVNEVAGLRVQCRVTKHPVPTIGLLVADGRSTLGWSSDTPFEQAHVDWLSAADVIVHESNVGPAHTPIESLNGLAPEIRAKMRLIHLQDDFDANRTDMMILRAGEVVSVKREDEARKPS